MTALTVTTWADAFGRWHASVPITGNARRDILTARRAILAELKGRGPFDPRAVRIVREHVTNHGTAVYGERFKA